MKNIKLVCFDVNKTLIQSNSWYDLNLALGLNEELDHRYLSQYRAGIITYQEWMKLLADSYKKSGQATKQQITQIASLYLLKPGAREIIGYLKSKKYQVVLITGSFDILAAAVAKDLGVEYWRANNKFIFDANDYLEEIVSVDDEAIAKLKFLKEFAEQFKIDLEQCACVGDGDNDILLFTEIGQGIAFADSDLVVQLAAKKIIGDLLEIRNIL